MTFDFSESEKVNQVCNPDFNTGSITFKIQMDRNISGALFHALYSGLCCNMKVKFNYDCIQCSRNMYIFHSVQNRITFNIF